MTLITANHESTAILMPDVTTTPFSSQASRFGYRIECLRSLTFAASTRLYDFATQSIRQGRSKYGSGPGTS